MQDPRLVRVGNIDDFLERRVRPQGEVVVGYSVGREEFFRVRVPTERSDLGRGYERVESG